MRMKKILPMMIGTALLIGCASTPWHDTTPVVMDPIVEAQQALANSNLRQAETYLGSAPSKLEAGDTRGQMRVLLLAELALRRGEDATAARLAKMVRSTDADDPRAAEILGKVALSQGRFSDAVSSFESARNFYTLNDDRQRVEDLKQLANGLAAYGNGYVSDAHQYWDSIHDASLRTQITFAYASVVKAESN